MHRHPTGLHRRELLQVGYSGLIGLGLSLVFAVFQIVGGFGDSDADGDGDGDGDALSILGVGKVPLMFVLVGFLGVFGLSGLLFNVICVMLPILNQ